MKIGLFFGSFNPVHMGHMALADYFVEFTDLDRLWFVISPHNPLKKKESLLNDQLRLDMVEMAINGDNRFEICDIEFRMPKPSYTIDTLAYLTENHPAHQFILVMGDDGLVNFHKWKNYREIIERYPRIIYPRDVTQKTDYSQHQNIIVLNEAPMIGISSSFIRAALAAGKNVQHFLPEKVYSYIERYNLYR